MPDTTAPKAEEAQKAARECVDPALKRNVRTYAKGQRRPVPIALQTSMPPLFVPLMGVYYDAFVAGTKTHE